MGMARPVNKEVLQKQGLQRKKCSRCTTDTAHVFVHRSSAKNGASVLVLVTAICICCRTARWGMMVALLLCVHCLCSAFGPC